MRAIAAALLALAPLCSAFLTPPTLPSFAAARHHATAESQRARSFGLPALRRAPLRVGVPALRAQADPVSEIQTQVELALVVGLPEAPAADIEELMAILTVTCRSLTRKIAKGGAGGDVAGQLMSSLKSKYVDEEGLLTDAQWESVKAAVVLPTQAAADPSASIRDAESSLIARLESYCASMNVDPDDVAEMKAIVVAHARSLNRRVSQGKAGDVSGAGLRAQLEADIKAKLSEEGLMDGSQFAVLAASASAGSAGEPPVDEQVFRMIHEPEAPLPEEAAPAMTAAAPAATAAVAPPPGGVMSMKTPIVTTGACTFGLCMDITTRDHPVTITALKTASSPGLNWGQGGAVRVKVFAAPGGSRGKELKPSAWTSIGYEEQVTLPMVSWADAEPEYGFLPLEQPIRIEAGMTAGIAIHTNDLYGLVMSVGAGAGGDVDFWDDDNEDEDEWSGGAFSPGDFVCVDDYIEVKAGYSLGAAVFEEFDNALAPQAGGFAGVIEYTVG